MQFDEAPGEVRTQPDAAPALFGCSARADIAPGPAQLTTASGSVSVHAVHVFPC